MTDEEELENYIFDWHSDKQLHKFAQTISMHLFQFIDHLSGHVSMNYGNSINKMHKAILKVRPDIEFIKRVKA